MAPHTAFYGAPGLLLPHGTVSPGPLHGRRVALRHSTPSAVSALVASHSLLFAVDFAIPQDDGPTSTGSLGPPRQLPYSTVVPVPLPPTMGEIAAVACHPSGGCGAVVDTVGRVAFGRFPDAESEPEGREPPEKRPRTEGAEGSGGWRVVAPAPQYADPGWAGVEFDPSLPGHWCAAREAPKDLVFGSGETLDRTIPLGLAPSALAYGRSATLSHCVIVAEGAVVSVFDLRAAGQGGRVRQVQVGHALVSALGTSALDSALVAATEGRSLHVIDPKTWQVRCAWPGVLKYDCSSLFTSRVRGGLWYVGGVHSEFRCGTGPKSDPTTLPFVSLQGDSGWLGLAQAPDTDTFVGLTDKGSLYLVACSL